MVAGEHVPTLRSNVPGSRNRAWSTQPSVHARLGSLPLARAIAPANGMARACLTQRGCKQIGTQPPAADTRSPAGNILLQN